jgi:hypothetical protein
VTGHEHALLRQLAGDLTDAELTACVRVLSRMLALFGEEPDPAAPEPGQG